MGNNKSAKSSKPSKKSKKKAKSETNYVDEEGGVDIGCIPKKVKRFKEQKSARQLRKKSTVDASSRTAKSRRSQPTLKTASLGTITQEAPTQTASKLLPSTKVEKSQKPKRSVRRVKTDGSVTAKSSTKSVNKPIVERGTKTDPVERTAQSVKRTSEDQDERTVTESIKRSFRNIRKKSMDTFTKVKFIVSRPIKEKNMLKLLERVNRREKEEQSDSDKLKPGDDFFPHVKPRATRPAAETKVEVESKKKDEPTKSAVETATQETTSKSTMKAPETEDDIMINGRPFWQSKGKGKSDGLLDPDEITDDQLPLSAAVLTEVYQDKIKLVDIPKMRLKLNPYATLDHLKNHDKLFTKDIIFSNTVRTMVNVIDEQDSNSVYQDTVEKLPEVDTNQKVDVQFEEPTILWTYDRKDPTIGGIAEEFTTIKNKLN